MPRDAPVIGKIQTILILQKSGAWLTTTKIVNQIPNANRKSVHRALRLLEARGVIIGDPSAGSRTGQPRRWIAKENLPQPKRPKSLGGRKRAHGRIDLEGQKEIVPDLIPHVVRNVPPKEEVYRKVLEEKRIASAQTSSARKERT